MYYRGCLQREDVDKQESGGGTSVDDETRMVAKDGMHGSMCMYWCILYTAG